MRRDEVALERSIARLTTTGRRTGLPREVEVYFVHRSGRVYLLAHRRSQWPLNLRANPRATLRVGSATFPIRATRIDDASDFVREVMELFREKYGEAEVAYWYEGTERWAIEAEILRAGTQGASR